MCKWDLWLQLLFFSLMLLYTLSPCQLLLWKFSLGKNFTAISSWHFMALQIMEILCAVLQNSAYKSHSNI